MSFTAYHEHLVEEQPEISLLINNAGCGYLVRCKTCGAESRYLRRGAVVRSIAQGRQDCRCRRCGGLLTSKEGVRNGIGHVCRMKALREMPDPNQVTVFDVLGDKEENTHEK